MASKSMVFPLIAGALLSIAYQWFAQPQVPAAANSTAPTPPVKIKVESKPTVKIKVEPKPAVKKQKGVDLVYATAFVPAEEEVEEVEEDTAKPAGEKRKRISFGATGERNPNQLSVPGFHKLRPGLNVYNPGSDGDCWFAAVVVGMWSIEFPGVPWTKSIDEEYQKALELRVEIVQYMLKNPKMYKAVLVADGKKPAMTMDKYCDKMSKPGEYVDGSVMEAFCVLYKIQISLYMRVDQRVQKLSDHGESNAGGTIKLYYSGNHYMCLHEC